MRSKRTSTARPVVRSLGEVLRDSGRPLSLPELFALAGYDRNEPADIELFYLALRSELGRSIRQVGDTAENGMVEAVPNAPQ